MDRIGLQQTAVAGTLVSQRVIERSPGRKWEHIVYAACDNISIGYGIIIVVVSSCMRKEERQSLL